MPTAKEPKPRGRTAADMGLVSPQGWVSLDAFAGFFDTSYMTVLRMVKEGRIPHIKLGRSIKLPKNAIDIYERQNIKGDRALIEKIWGKDPEPTPEPTPKRKPSPMRFALKKKTRKRQ